MTNKTPLVSIVTPMYNAERYIEGAVRSMLGQTFTDFEHIIVDDGSSDGSPAMVDGFAAEDARIRVIHLAKNGGYSHAINTGAKEAKGKYIAWMDADDLSHPERLARQVAYLESHPDTGVVATQYAKMDDDGRILRKARNRLDNLLLRFHLLFGVPVCNPSVMYRRSLLAQLGKDAYDTRIVAAPDYDFFIRAAKLCAMHVLPEYLFYYRINTKGLSKARRDTLVAEAIPLALGYAQSLGTMSVAEKDLMTRFLPLQLDQRTPLTKETLATYVAGMRLMRRHYGKTLGWWPRYRVALFALEVEAKTLLGRYRLVKRPALLLAWLRLRAGL